MAIRYFVAAKQAAKVVHVSVTEFHFTSLLDALEDFDGRKPFRLLVVWLSSF